MTGIFSRPRSFAARIRPCPPSVVEVSSMSTGTRKPKTPMLSAIWRICFFECVRALRGLGLIASRATSSILCMSTSVTRPGRGAISPSAKTVSGLRNSGADHVELGRVASLAVLRRHWRLGRLSAGFAEHHPASIACRPDVDPGDLQRHCFGGSRALPCNLSLEPTPKIDKNPSSRQWQ